MFEHFTEYLTGWQICQVPLSSEGWKLFSFWGLCPQSPLQPPPHCKPPGLATVNIHALWRSSHSFQFPGNIRKYSPAIWDTTTAFYQSAAPLYADFFPSPFWYIDGWQHKNKGAMFTFWWQWDFDTSIFPFLDKMCIKTNKNEWMHIRHHIDFTLSRSF